MSTKIDDGGPAFPTKHPSLDPRASGFYTEPGLSLRDYFAACVQADDRLVKCVRAMDDVALEVFALYPNAERDEHITETGPLEGKIQWIGMSQVEKVTARLTLEAKAIARVRYMQADAMLAARKERP